MFSKYKHYKLLNILGTVLLVVYGFFMAQLIVVFCVQAMADAGVLGGKALDSALVQFNAAFVAYMLALGIILGLFCAIKNSTQGVVDLLAITKSPKFRVILYVALGYGAYFVLTFVFGAVAQLIIPGFNAEEQQEVGFNNLNNFTEYLMAFLALVVLAPIVEELIFRGFMYSRVRKDAGFIATSLIVSLTFGFIHMQWNVGIDVFALSLVLCYLREKTESIWAGVGVHMLKNTMAFSVLFLHIFT